MSSWDTMGDDPFNDASAGGMGGMGGVEPQSEIRSVLQSVETLDNLSKSKDKLVSQMLADLDNESSLQKQVNNLNIKELNNEVSDGSEYKSDVDPQEEFVNELLNNDSYDLLKKSTGYSVSTERKKRYDIYDQILDSNYIAFRILRVYLNNILIRNAQTKNFLNIKFSEEKEQLINHLGKEVKQAYEQYSNSILLLFKIPQKLKDDIVPKALLYGNMFMEIIDLGKLDEIGNHTELLLLEGENPAATSINRLQFNNEVTLLSESEGLQQETSLNTLKGKLGNIALSCVFESNFETVTEEVGERILLENTAAINTQNISYDDNVKNYNASKEKFDEAYALYESELQKYNAEINIIKETFDFDSVTNPEDKKKIQAIQESGFDLNTILNKPVAPEAPVRPSNPKGQDFLTNMLLENNAYGTEELDYLDSITGFNQSQIQSRSHKKKFKVDDMASLDLTKIGDIHLASIHPKNVIIIEKDGMIFGYLIIEEDTDGSSGEYQVDSFKRLSQGLTNSMHSAGTDDANEKTVKEVTKNLSNEIIKKVVHNVNYQKKRFLGGNQHKVLDSLDISTEALASLKLIIYNKIKAKSKLKFRFLTPETLVNFSTTVDKFAPYGTSVFDPIVGPVKYYTLALMSSIVSRLSRAAVVRKWTIESGTKRNHKELVEKTRAELKSKSITFDKINSIKNISEIVTDYKDLASISINGNKYIDMEILPLSDRGLPLNDLEDLKNDIIAAGGVPAVYLNIGDSVDLREALVHLNISFANEVITRQQLIEDSTNLLHSNIFKKVLTHNGYDDAEFFISNYSQIKLNPPLVLQIQSDEALITTVSNIGTMLENSKLKYDPKSLYKRYIPSIDWDELEDEGRLFVQSLGKEAITSPDGMGGGMM